MLANPSAMCGEEQLPAVMLGLECSWISLKLLGFDGEQDLLATNVIAMYGIPGCLETQE